MISFSQRGSLLSWLRLTTHHLPEEVEGFNRCDSHDPIKLVSSSLAEEKEE